MMQVFLGAVGAYAATDAPWLLHKRFSGLLPDEASAIVQESRTLHVRASREGPVFNPLTSALGRLGADTDEA